MIKKSLVISSLLISVSAFAITAHTVKSGDSLWRIANKYKISGIPTKDMIKAIKGINSKENPSINDDIVNLKQNLAIPTTKQEVDDGLKLYTLRHTQYLGNTSSQQKPTVTTAKEKPTSITVSHEQKKPHTPPLTEITPNNTDQIQQPTQTQQASPSQGIIVSADQASDRNSNSPDTDIQENNTTNQGSFSWFIVLLIAIAAILVWRRFKRKKAKQEDVTQVMKDQFYAQAQTTDNTAEPTTIKTSKVKKDVKKTLQQANQLIDSHDIPQAKAILQEALNTEPKNLDIRIKLLAVYGADGDAISFNSERDYLASNLLPYDDSRWKHIESLYQKYFGMQMTPTP